MAPQDAALTAPKHNTVNFGIWVKICLLFTKYSLQFEKSVFLVKEPALRKVYLRLHRTAVVPEAIMTVIMSKGCSVKCVRLAPKPQKMIVRSRYPVLSTFTGSRANRKHIKDK